jgi:hypothetical protein
MKNIYYFYLTIINPTETLHDYWAITGTFSLLTSLTLLPELLYPIISKLFNHFLDLMFTYILPVTGVYRLARVCLSYVVALLFVLMKA